MSVSRSKAGGRHALQTFMPSSFISGPVPGVTPDVIIEDALVTLRSLGSGVLDPADSQTKIISCNDIMLRMKASAEYALSNYNSRATDYVYCFDKHNLVPIAKGHTQKKRMDSSNTTKLKQYTDDFEVKESKDETEGLDEPDGSEDEVDDDNDDGSSPKTNKKKKKNVEKKPPPDRRPADGIDFKKRRPYLRLNTDAPRDLALALEDREDTKCEIIRNIVSCWIDYTGSGRIDVPVDKSVTIVGHYITPVIASKLNFSNQLVDDTNQRSVDMSKLTSTDWKDLSLILLMHITPIRLMRITETTWRLEWANELRNYLGEADFSMFYIYRMLCKEKKKKLVAEIVTIDTDILWYSLIYLDKFKSESPTIIWKYDPHPKWVFFCGTPLYRKGSCVYINRLYHDIQNANWTNIPPPPVDTQADIRNNKVNVDLDKNLPLVVGSSLTKSGKKSAVKETKRKPKGKRDLWEDYKSFGEAQKIDFRKLKYNVITLVIAMISAGGDYTIGLPNITHEVILHTLRRHSAYIGDLVSKVDYSGNRKTILDGTAFAKFIKCAYMVAKDVREKPEKYPTAIDKKKPSLLDPASIEYKKLQSMYEHLVPKNRPPPTSVLIIHGKQLMFCMKLAFQIGERKLTEPLCLDYEYELIDPTKQLMRDNVKLRLVTPSTYKND